jgi:hypothetical protein
MALYRSEFIRLTFGFTDTSSSETAYTSLNLSNNEDTYDSRADLAAIDSTWLLARATNLVNLLTASAVGGWWANYSSLTSVKAAAIAVGGFYLEDPKIANNTGAQGTRAIHPQLSVALSLWSGQTLGKGNYGRMYLPHTFIPLATSTSHGGTTETGAIADAALTFVRAINTAADALPQSGTRMYIMGSKGSKKAVTKIRVGNVTDTQRRRRNALADTFTDRTV